MLIALSLKCEPLGKFQELSTYHYSKESSRMRWGEYTELTEQTRIMPVITIMYLDFSVVTECQT